ncbi:MAG: RecX family transcriptional regulator [Ruminococcus sp.]|uniref:regulatory protein RecX n=1 Tax=Ruminococcus sp. TaxID=41978 RepID=UPI0025D2CD09|nr:RecX family transcriptional regulator [Ruminococcus sp.]MCR5600470.1 RecX family transcriptional regulator [Ruminococcus sp.]
MKITSVTRYKGSTYEAELDDGRKLYLHADIITDFGIHAGMETDRETLRKIIYASNFRRAYQRALYLLDYRDYTYSEMFKKLVENYKSEALCTAVMKRLTEHGFIDDVRYAERMARKLVEIKRFGRRRSKRELMQKGISDFIAEDALAPYSEVFEENLMELLRTKHSRYLTDREDKRSIEKVKSALVRYGYEFTEINRAVKDYFENAEELEEEN